MTETHLVQGPELVDDMWKAISHFIDDGVTWKSWLFTCKLFASMNTREKVARVSNHLMTLRMLFPDKICKIYLRPDVVLDDEKWDEDDVEEKEVDDEGGDESFEDFEYKFDDEGNCYNDGDHREIFRIEALERQEREADDDEDDEVDDWFLEDVNYSFLLNPCFDPACLNDILGNVKDTDFWVTLSYNRRIDLAMVIKYKNRPWIWNALIGSKNISIQDIIGTPGLKCDWPSIFEYSYILEQKDILDAVIMHKDEIKDWSYISRHPQMTMEIIEAHPELPWDHQELSSNPRITWEYILAHPSKEWDMKQLQQNGVVPICPHTLVPKSRKNISCNPLVTPAVIRANPRIKWNYIDMFCYNPSMREYIVENHYEELQKYPIYGWKLAKTINISFIDRFPDLKWDWSSPGAFEGINVDFLTRHIHKLQRWDKLIHFVPIDDPIIFNPEFYNKPGEGRRSGFDSLHLHPDITWEFFEKHPQHRREVASRSGNKNLQYWGRLAQTPMVTWDHVVKNWEAFTCCPELSSNPNITWEIVVNNPDIKWDWVRLGQNPFNKK